MGQGGSGSRRRAASWERRPIWHPSNSRAPTSDPRRISSRCASRFGRRCTAIGPSRGRRPLCCSMRSSPVSRDCRMRPVSLTGCNGQSGVGWHGRLTIVFPRCRRSSTRCEPTARNDASVRGQWDCSSPASRRPECWQTHLAPTSPARAPRHTWKARGAKRGATRWSLRSEPPTCPSPSAPWNASNHA